MNFLSQKISTKLETLKIFFGKKKEKEIYTCMDNIKLKIEKHLFYNQVLQLTTPESYFNIKSHDFQ